MRVHATDGLALIQSADLASRRCTFGSVFIVEEDMKTLASLLLLVCIALPAHAQETRARITGAVVDAPGLRRARRDGHGAQPRHQRRHRDGDQRERPVHDSTAAARAVPGHGGAAGLQDLLARRHRAPHGGDRHRQRAARRSARSKRRSPSAPSRRRSNRTRAPSRRRSRTSASRSCRSTAARSTC